MEVISCLKIVSIKRTTTCGDIPEGIQWNDIARNISDYT